MFQTLLALTSFDFRIPYAHYQAKGELDEHHRVKIAKAIVLEILEKDPEQK